MNIFSTIATIIAAPIIFLSSLFNPVPAQAPIVEPVAAPIVGAALPQATGVFETSLATPITSTATTMTLTENAVRGGGSLAGYTCFTIDEGTAQAEVVCGTVSSTTVSSMTRGISYADGTSSVTANKFSHRRGANIKITDFPILQILKAQNNGDETFPNPLKYDTGIGPLASSDLADKEYVLSVVSGGSVSFEKVVITGTAGETVAAGTPVYLKAADGRWWKAVGTTAATVDNVQLGIAQGAGTAGNAISGGVLIKGTDTNQSGGAAGSIGYISDTSTIATVAGTIEKAVGNFISATNFVFNPIFYYGPTANQKAAFAGTGGTPSASNKFLTEQGSPAVDVQTFTAIGGNKTFTVTLASPGVFTLNNHGFTAGSPIYFTTDGALPTGLTASTVYYVIAGGLTTNTFEVAATAGGTAINTSGSQSGTHTAHNAWVKPTNAKMVQVILVGGGGGGAGGVNGSTGGAGGGGGAANVGTFKASDLGTNEEVKVGAGGGGGAINTIGGDGTLSAFGTWILAGGGGGGAGINDGGGGGGVIGSASGSTGGAPAVGGNAIGGQGPTAGATVRSGEWGGGSGGSSNSATAGSSSIYGAGGGGAGGVTGTGTAGGTVGAYTIGGGGAAGGSGSPGVAGSANSVLKKGYGGAGGGGGGGAVAGTAGAGAIGGFPGGGGGGGGGTGSSSAGVGGDGAKGQVIVITYF